MVTAKGWSRGLGTEFFLFTPPSVGQCQDSAGNSCFDPDFPPAGFPGYCAYHSWISGSPQTLYAVQPWADITGCVDSYQVPDSPYPNDDGADPLVSLISQAQNETMTDPLGTGWYETSSGGTFEDGSECAFLALSTHYNGIGDYSQTINGDQYLMQAEWSNRAKACVETNTYAQPTGTFTASAGSTAHSEKFVSTVSDSDDTSFRYAWTFGDGTTSTAVNPTHTYSSAGTKTITLTVFDPHGDQLHLGTTVPVS